MDGQPYRLRPSRHDTDCPAGCAGAARERARHAHEARGRGAEAKGYYMFINHLPLACLKSFYKFKIQCVRVASLNDIVHTNMF